MKQKIYKNFNIQPSNFSPDFYCVIDFEATCEENNPHNYKHEIIEFPALMVNAQTLSVDSKFHAYCKPVINPKLSTFCVKLTGIDQVGFVLLCRKANMHILTFYNWVDVYSSKLLFHSIKYCRYTRYFLTL